LDGAVAAAVADARLDTKKAILQEWRDWQSVEGLSPEDVQRSVEEDFGVAVFFKKPIDARNFMNRIYDEFMASVRKETGPE
jgi:hypothetical protein